MPSQYDSPTQTGGYDSAGGDPWFDYDAQQEESDSEYEREIRWQMRSHPDSPDEPYSPSRVLSRSRSSSSLSFSVLTRDSFSVSPLPIGDASFSPLTPSNGIEQPLTPLPALHEWFMTGQPVYDILTLPPDDIPATPPPQQSLSDDAPGQQPAALNDAPHSGMQQSVHELTLSQFFDAQGVREITEALAQQQQQASEQVEETVNQSEEIEERYFLREEDIDMSAIRERSVVDIRFATEMPTPEPEQPQQPAAAPQAGYTAPAPFIPPYTHFMHEPTVNDGRLPHQVEALEYLCAALFVDSDRLKWSLLHRPVECFNQLVGMTTYCHATKRFSTIAHMTAITPEAHISVTGNSYIHYLQQQLNYTVVRDDFPMVELSDGFLAPLESLTIYYHI